MPGGTPNSVKSELDFSLTKTQSECGLQQGIKTKIAQAGLAPLLCSGLTPVSGTTLGVTLVLWIDGKKPSSEQMFLLSRHSCMLYMGFI